MNFTGVPSRFRFWFVDDWWECKLCEVSNPSTTSTCEACESVHDDTAREIANSHQSLRSSPLEQKTQRREVVKHVNASMSDAKMAPAASGWTCEVCDTPNAANESVCGACMSERPESVEIVPTGSDMNELERLAKAQAESGMFVI